MPSQKEREKAVRIKLNPIPAHLKDKSIVLVDDSIVRGTTSRRIIEMMREAGAREIHMRIGSPAIKAPCYLGVDMPTREELIASNRDRRRGPAQDHGDHAPPRLARCARRGDRHRSGRSLHRLPDRVLPAGDRRRAGKDAPGRFRGCDVPGKARVVRSVKDTRFSFSINPCLQDHRVNRPEYCKGL